MFFFRLLLPLLLLLIPCAGMSQAPTDSLRQAALLAARGEVHQLRPIYDAVRHRLPRHTQYYCQLAFARAEGRTNDVVALIDTLEQMYERKLDVRGLLALAHERCEALRYQGQWAELASYAEGRLAWAKRRRIRVARQKYLKAYQELGMAHLQVPPVSVHWLSDDFVVPRLATDTVATIAVQVNGEALQPALVTPFGRHTIVAASTLTRLGLEVQSLPTLPITTATGEEMMHAVRLDSLRIGDCLFRNLVVYAYDDSNVQVDFPILIGLDILRRLSTLSVQAQHLQVRRHLPFSPSPLRIVFSSGGWLMVSEGDKQLRAFESADLFGRELDFEHLLLH